MTEMKHGIFPRKPEINPGRRGTPKVLLSHPKKEDKKEKETHLFFLLPSQRGEEQGCCDVITDHLGTSYMLLLSANLSI